MSLVFALSPILVVSLGAVLLMLAEAFGRPRVEAGTATLDAGAGRGWRYQDQATDIAAQRSEGLALASLRLFEWGGFSSDPRDPLRADAEALARFDASALADAFQVSAQIRSPASTAARACSICPRLSASLTLRA